MSSGRTDPTNDTVTVSVKRTVRDYYHPTFLLESMVRELTDLMDDTNMSCYPLEITLSLTVEKSSPSKQS